MSIQSAPLPRVDQTKHPDVVAFIEETRPEIEREIRDIKPPYDHKVVPYNTGRTESTSARQAA